MSMVVTPTNDGTGIFVFLKIPICSTPFVDANTRSSEMGADIVHHHRLGSGTYISMRLAHHTKTEGSRMTQTDTTR